MLESERQSWQRIPKVLAGLRKSGGLMIESDRCRV